MKNTTLCIIIFSIIIIFSGLINSGVIENLVPMPGQIDIIDKIEQCSQLPCFMKIVRYFITLFGAVVVQIFALIRNFNGSIRFLRRFFPNRSNIFYTRADFCICVIIGSIIGCIFYSPQSPVGALAAGFSWQGAMTMMITRERDAPGKKRLP